MRKDPEEPEYRVYRSGGSTHAARRADRGDGPASSGFGGTGGAPDSDDAPAYNVYRSQPRGLGARLRGETDSEIGRRVEDAERAPVRSGGGGARRRGRRRGAAGLARWGLRTWTVWRAVKYLVLAAVAWLVLSVVLFFVSASTRAGNIPASLAAALSPAGSPMLFSAQNVLVIGLDDRPTTGYSAHEGGAQHSEATARTDTLMLWHIGGGVSRKLSIPRDTLVNIPGFGESKINAAWALGSDHEGTTVKVVEALTGLKINHVIVVDLGRFASFIDDIGGVNVTTPRICSVISGGPKNGGYALFLKPGSHHLDGTQALTLARTRENRCDPAYNDLNREAAQQEVLNGIRSQLLSVPAFLNAPSAAWDAPGVVQTDLGGLGLTQLFLSAELGGSTKPLLLSEHGAVVGGADVLVPNPANVRVQVSKLLNG